MSVRFGLATTLALLATFADPALAQPDAADLVAHCDGKFGLCRYVDRKTQRELIPPRYELAGSFSEGLAAVRIDGRFGYIDASGAVVIAPSFEFAGAFHNGLAEIVVDDKAGVIDRTGRIVVPPSFARAVPWTKDVIFAEEGSWQSARYDGFDELKSLKEKGPRGLFGLYHVSGYWIRKPDLASISHFIRDGGAPIWAAPKDSRNRFGLLTPEGQWLVEPQFDNPGPLVDGQAVVRTHNGTEGLAGIVGPAGEIALPLQPIALGYRESGWTIISERGTRRRGFVDDQGNLIGGRYFDGVRMPKPPNRDIAFVLVDGLWKGIDRAGTLLPHPDNGRLVASCPQGLRAVFVGGKSQLVDANGLPTSPHLLDGLRGQLECSRPIAIRLGSKQGFVGIDGRLLVDPPTFDNQYGFGDGHAPVQQDGKWGLIDTTGRFVLPTKFDEYKGSRGGVFQFALDGRNIWFTPAGEETTAPPPDDLSKQKAEMLNCGHGMRLFERDGRWGITEAGGREVVAPQYRALSCFRHGVAWAAMADRRAWCALGPDGTARAQPKCQPFFFPVMMMHHHPDRMHDDPFESNVLWARAYFEFAAGKRDTFPPWDPNLPPGRNITPR
jgi:hypothetical protein